MNKTLPVFCRPVLLALTFGCALAGEPMSSWRSPWADLSAGQVIRGSTLDLAELSITGEALGAGESGRHSGPAEELLVVQRGRVTVAVDDGEPVTVGPGSVAVRMPGEALRLSNPGDEPAAVYRFRYRTHLGADARRGVEAGGSLIVDWDAVEFVPSDIGGRRQMFDRPTAMFDDFEMHVSTLDGGLTNHPAHTHRAEEFVLVVEGTVALQVGDETMNAGPGDLIYIESMIPHSLDNTGDDAATYFAFQFRQ